LNSIDKQQAGRSDDPDDGYMRRKETISLNDNLMLRMNP
jgi:hypothetical protein